MPKLSMQTSRSGQCSDVAKWVWVCKLEFFTWQQDEGVFRAQRGLVGFFSFFVVVVAVFVTEEGSEPSVDLLGTVVLQKEQLFVCV